jgi:hypothetical protein
MLTKFDAGVGAAVRDVNRTFDAVCVDDLDAGLDRDLEGLRGRGVRVELFEGGLRVDVARTRAPAAAAFTPALGSTPDTGKRLLLVESS